MLAKWAPLAAVAFALAGCGGNEEPDVNFPPIVGKLDGQPRVPVQSGAEADELCEATRQQSWPYEEHPAVTFDIPDTDVDLICVGLVPGP